MPTIKARIGGAWVPVGGGGVDEVWIGTAAPTDTATELWYDTDEPNLYEPDTARWNSAWGVVAKMSSPGGNVVGAGGQVGTVVSFTSVIGRRYRIYGSTMITSTVAGDVASATLKQSGTVIVRRQLSCTVYAQAIDVDYFHDATVVGVQTWTLWVIRELGTGTITGYADTTALQQLTVEDVGPVSLASSPPAQPSSVWTNVTFQNGWTDFDSVRTVRYRMLGDMVQIQGLMKGGTAAVGTAAFVLPVGYRPRADVQFIVAASPTSGINNVWVNNVGVVSTAAIGAGSANTYVYLDAVAFSVTP